MTEPTLEERVAELERDARAGLRDVMEAIDMIDRLLAKAVGVVKELEDRVKRLELQSAPGYMARNLASNERVLRQETVVGWWERGRGSRWGR